MDTLLQDLRYAFRTLTRSPGFLAAAVATLALGIGLNSAVFSVVNGLVLKPLPVASPEELVAIYSAVPDEFMSHAPLSTSDYEHLRDETRSLAEVIATTYKPLALEHDGQSRLVLGERVSANYFSFLGLEPGLGRTFEDEDGDADTVVLSHTAWRRRYGSDPGVLGRTVRVNGRPVTVIAVAPEGFSGLTRGIAPELWQPLSLKSTSRGEASGFRWLWITGRLAEGYSASEARAEVAILAERLRRTSQATEERDFALVPRSQVKILPGVDGKLFSVAALALGGVALVLLIASANVANMLLARAAGRRQEIAARLALGAGPATIVRQLLSESAVLSALGGGLGLLGAAGANAALESLRLPVPVDLVFGAGLDVRVIAFTLAVSTLTTLIFGLAPAIEAARTDLTAALREGSDAAPGGRTRRRWRGSLVVAQVALSLVLLICAGLCVKSLRNAFRIDPGFDAQGVVVASFAPRLQSASERTSLGIEEFYDRLLARIRGLPGVDSAGLTSHLPLAVEFAYEKVAPAGLSDGDRSSPETWPRVDTATVGPGYFETLRIALLRGRTFQDHDTAESSWVAVVNESFARRFWPEVEALGQELYVDGVESAYRVTGVVGDGKYRTLGEPSRPFLYLAFAQGRWHRQGHGGEITTGTETVAVRTVGDPTAALASIRRVAREIDESVAMSRLSTLEESLGPALAPTRLAAGLFSLFGLLGLALAAMGIYAVMAYATSRRTREIGIRMALGARRGDVLRLIMRDALSLTALGVILGFACASASTRAISAFLYGVSATDALTWTSVALLLAVVALLASYVPARRAAGIDPQSALRSQ